MFRQGLRRCALQASTASYKSTAARSALSSALTKTGASSASRTIQPIRAFQQLVTRSYSTESEAQDVQGEVHPSSEKLTNFSQLSALNVHRNLVAAITDGMGYDAMTPVQAATLAPALKGTDIVAQAKTGTGKTLAFLLPLLQRMINDDPSLANRAAMRSARSDDIRGIVLSPTRELAEQIATEAKRLVKHTGLVVQSAVGGTRKSDMLRQTQRQGCHLLVATPGRLNDLLQDSSSGIDAPSLSALVLDEADRMLDVGFEKELNEIMSYLPNSSEKTRQTMLVSATIPDDVIRLARTMVRPDDFEFVQTIPENESLTHDKVPQAVVSVPGWLNVWPTIFELLAKEDRALAAGVPSENGRVHSNFKAIVYFNTTAMVQLAGEIGYMRRTNHVSTLPSYSIHSGLSQQQRTRAADSFRRARSGVLYSSDVTARGMDFPNVTHVIQVGVPSDREAYIHRLGRTGRQDKEGKGYIILPESEVRQARNMLRGLPIEPDKTLEEPNAEWVADDLTKYQKEAQDVLSGVPPRFLQSAYMSLFGRSADKVVTAKDLNRWLTLGVGREQPPAVTPTWARKMGVDRVSSMNLDSRSERDDDRPFTRRDGGRDDWRDNRRDNRRFSSDPFSRMGSAARRDNDDRRRGTSF